LKIPIDRAAVADPIGPVDRNELAEAAPIKKYRRTKKMNKFMDIYLTVGEHYMDPYWAAEQAGYDRTKPNQSGAELMQMVPIKEMLAEYMASRGASPQRVIDRLCDIAFRPADVDDIDIKGTDILTALKTIAGYVGLTTRKLSKANAQTVVGVNVSCASEKSASTDLMHQQMADEANRPQIPGASSPQVIVEVDAVEKP